MSAEIAKFTGDTTNARTHVTFAIDDLARDYAKAYEVGYRNGLNDVNPTPAEKTRLLTNHLLSYETRVNLYEAIIRAQIEGKR